MPQSEKQNFENILNVLSTRLKIVLYQINDDVLNSLQEIRIRVNKPVVLVTDKGSYFINEKCILTKLFSPSCIVASAQETADTVNRICSFSLHSNQQNINNGFVTISGGHRVGLCGTAVQLDDKNFSVKDISCINIRIARQIFGVAQSMTDVLFKDGLKNVIIAGPPSSGKTTLLRDLCYRLSSGYTGSYIKTAVIDERGEFSGSYSGIAQFDLGLNCDALINYKKKQAVEIALRSLSPEYIIFDEICSFEDVKVINQGLNSGVFFAVSMHCGDEIELKSKQILVELIKTGFFDNVILLDNSNSPCKIKKVISVSIEENEIIWTDSCINL